MAKPITELDFATIKTQLRTYLEAQDKFKDYDFAGSNLSVLLDLLAYNTYQNNFYTNMAFSEAFLDTAQLEESIMSHAKSLNYLPRSAKSAMAVVDVTISSTEGEATIKIPEGTKFTATGRNGEKFTFYTDEGHVATRVGSSNTYTATCVSLYEGSLVEELFTATAGFESFAIGNENIDTDSLRVFNTSNNDEEYLFRNDIFGADADSAVFYLEPDKKSYNIVFGRDTYGKDPAQGDIMKASYRTSSGAKANRANAFTTSAFSNATVTVRSRAVGGLHKERLNQIRFFAPRSIQVQERAVTRKDYEILLKQRFPKILDVSVDDGAELDPPQHGKVAITVAVTGGISTSDQDAFTNYLYDKTPLAIQPVFIDADYMYLDTVVTVYVNNNTRTISNADIRELVKDVASQYNDDNLETFGSVFRESRLTELINDADPSFLSSAVVVRPYIEYNPQTGVSYSPIFKFRGELVKPYPFSETAGLTNYKPAIKGESFVYNGVNAFFQDDGDGNIQIISSDVTNVDILNPEIGSVNYDTGRVRLSDFKVDSFTGSAIKVYANQSSEDIRAPRNRVLILRKKDITVNISGSRA